MQHVRVFISSIHIVVPSETSYRSTFRKDFLNLIGFTQQALGLRCVEPQFDLLQILHKF